MFDIQNELEVLKNSNINTFKTNDSFARNRNRIENLNNIEKIYAVYYWAKLNGDKKSHADTYIKTLVKDQEKEGLKFYQILNKRKLNSVGALASIYQELKNEKYI